VLLAELLERTGQPDRAQAILSSATNSKSLRSGLQARSSIVLGRIERRRGHLREAETAFRLACAQAESGGDLEQLCWAQLRLTKILWDAPANGLVTDLQSELRSNVARLGSSQVSVAYHIFAAESEAKKGDMAASRRHTDLAESLLVREPNVWLRGLLDIQHSCLHYLAGGYEQALTCAIRAVESSKHSGDSETRTVALADLAAAYLALGHLARAGRCIDAALSCSDQRDQGYGLLVESLAETKLAERDLEACRTLLSEAQTRAADLLQSRSDWHRTWNTRTELRLLLRSGRVLDLAKRVGEITDDEQPRWRSFADRQLSVVKIRALVLVGNVRGAAESLALLIAQPSDKSLSSVGQLYDALAAIIARDRGVDIGAPFSMRALRMLATGAEVGAHLDAVDEMLTAAGRIGSGPRTASCGLDTRSLRRPLRIYCHLGNATSFLKVAQVSCDELLSLCAALPELLTKPMLAAEEFLRLVSRLGWIRAGCVGLSSPDGCRSSVWTTLRHPELAEPNDPKNTTNPTSVRVSFGEESGQLVTLTLDPVADHRSGLNCVLLRRLIENVKATVASARDKPDTPPRLASDEKLRKYGVFRSRSMIELVDTAQRIATLDVAVLLTGESGTGKEVIARIIHESSRRVLGPFIPFNCANLPKELVDSQLFGHRRGAFTGASESFGGVVKAASRGTLFLDEIGELPLDVQPKLLRFLDAMEIHPLGESKPQRVDVRIVAATNANLEQLVAAGKFREDLYYRLNVFRFRLPPLRERREEIPELVASFLEQSCREFDRNGVQISDEALEHVMLSRWPGNLRQLKHEIRRVVALAESESLIPAKALSPDVLDISQADPPAVPGQGSSTLWLRVDSPLPDLVEQVERAAITRALTATGGRTEEAATRLGLSRKGLYLKRRRLGL